MNFEETLNKMQEKIGKETSGIIADDIASLLSYENARNKEIKNKDSEIEKLKKDKEMLIEANGNLLQSIPMGKDPEKEIDDEDKKPFDFRTIFDESGKLKK